MSEGVDKKKQEYPILETNFLLKFFASKYRTVESSVLHFETRHTPSSAHSETIASPMKVARLSAVRAAGFLLSAPYVRSQMASNNVEKRVNVILAQMSFDDKISYIGGTGFFM